MTIFKKLLIHLFLISSLVACVSEEETIDLALTFSHWNDEVYFAELIISGPGGYSECITTSEENIILSLCEGNHLFYATFFQRDGRVVGYAETSAYIEDGDSLNMEIKFLTGDGDLMITFNVPSQGSYVVLNIGKRDGEYLLKNLTVRNSEEGFGYDINDIPAGEYVVDSILYDENDNYLSEKSSNIEVTKGNTTTLLVSFTSFDEESLVLSFENVYGPPIEARIVVNGEGPGKLTLTLDYIRIPLGVMEDDIDVYWYLDGTLAGTGNTITPEKGGRYDVVLGSETKGTYGSSTFYIEKKN